MQPPCDSMKLKFTIQLLTLHLFRERKDVSVRFQWLRPGSRRPVKTAWHDGTQHISVNDTLTTTLNLTRDKSNQSFPHKNSRLTLEIRRPHGTDAGSSVAQYGKIDINLTTFVESMIENNELDHTENKKLYFKKCVDAKACVDIDVHVENITNPQRQLNSDANTEECSDGSVLSDLETKDEDIKSEEEDQSVQTNASVSEAHKTQIRSLLEANSELRDRLADAELAKVHLEMEVEQLRRQVDTLSNDPSRVFEALATTSCVSSPSNEFRPTSDMSIADQLAAISSNTLARESSSALMALADVEADNEADDESSMTFRHRCVTIDDFEGMTPGFMTSEGTDALSSDLEDALDVATQKSLVWSTAVQRLSLQLTPDTANAVKRAQSAPNLLQTFPHDLPSRRPSYESDVVSGIEKELTDALSENIVLERKYEDEKDRADELEKQLADVTSGAEVDKHVTDELTKQLETWKTKYEVMEKKFVNAQLGYAHMMDRFHELEAEHQMCLKRAERRARAIASVRKLSDGVKAEMIAARGISGGMC